MPKCIYCLSEYIDERYESGYEYCLDEKCQKIGLDVSEREFRKVYTPALLHKCNYFWVKKTELKSLNVRADLLQQKED
jgi:hypothetical protein